MLRLVEITCVFEYVIPHFLILANGSQGNYGKLHYLVSFRKNKIQIVWPIIIKNQQGI